MYTNCEEDCEHNFVMDLIDIDPDRSQIFYYCENCHYIPPCKPKVKTTDKQTDKETKNTNKK